MKIAVIQARPGIGDILVFLPYIHLIAKNKKTKIYLFTKKRTVAHELLKYDPYIEEVIYLDREPKKINLNLIKDIKIRDIKTTYIMHFGFRYIFLCLLSGVRKINFYGIFRKKVSITKFISYKTAKWLGIDDPVISPNLYWGRTSVNNNQIVIGIGGSGSNKKWAIENYSKLISLIINLDLKYKILIAGGYEEIKDFEQISNKNNFKNLVNLCHHSIPQAIDEIIGSKIFVGNDTGFMHICGSLGIKSFGIFGNTPSDYCSYNKKITPIMPEGFKHVNYDDNALDLIKPLQVFKMIKPHI